jgi:2-keto-3-deoxy-galactonokinase
MLFRTRTRGVLGKQEGPANRDFLSGLLIGAELAELGREPGAAPILLAAGSIGRTYETAARAVGLGGRLVLATREQFEAAVTRGHMQLLKRFSGTRS